MSLRPEAAAPRSWVAGAAGLRGWLRRLRPPSLPLLGRELVEVANRRMTYVLRVVLVLVVLLVVHVSIAAMNHALAAYHQYAYFMGRQVLTEQILAAFIAVLIVLPASAALSVTQEREQGTHLLLLMTPMRPGLIILQKYLVLVLSISALVLVLLPTLGVAYSLGGVNRGEFDSFILLVVQSILEIAAVGLAIGAWFQRSIAALIASYLITLMLLLGIPFGYMAAGHRNFSLQGAAVLDWPLTLSPMVMVDHGTQHPLLLLVPTVFTAGLLVLARAGFVRIHGGGGEGGGGSAWFGMLRRFDRWCERCERLVWIRRRSASLPVRDPVLWLELHRRSFSSARYLFRLFVPLGAVTILLGLGVSDTSTVRTIGCMGLIVTVLIVCMLNSGALSQERSQQTLAVLLTTQLTARAIVAQKMRALGRVRWALTGCALAALLLGRHQNLVLHGQLPQSLVQEVLNDALLAWQLIVVPAGIGWLAMRIGMRVPNQRRAAIGALLASAAVLLGPLLLHAAWHGQFSSMYAGSPRDSAWQLETALVMISPIDVLCLDQHVDGVAGLGLWSGGRLCLAVPAVQLAAWALLRRDTLNRAERILAAAGHGR